MRTLKELDLSRTGARDLFPLGDLSIEKLTLNSSKVTDLAPLRSLPLRRLDLRMTQVGDIKPLAGLPLEWLDCTAIPTADFSALAGAPLKTLNLQNTRVGDLSFLRGMPLEVLVLHGCQLARGFVVLPELKSLTVLLLPDRVWNLPEEELAALAALRQHPALRQIETGIAMAGQHINITESAAAFWKTWDRDLSCVLALHRDGVKFSRNRHSNGGLSVTITDPTFKDLTVFLEANLTSLILDGTSVTDLTPLAGLPLKSLQLTRTPVTDLSPVASLAGEFGGE
jgi:Leucine-rich repeat (LRR) protein